MTAGPEREVRIPDLPPGREVELPGRGRLFVRELPGPSGAPTLVLLHGWTVTADLNFFTCYRALGRHFRVIAFDQRGHGRGLRTSRWFRLADCADDAAAVATALGVERFIPVGYSMGGPVAQLTWRRHPNRVDGLVLCATANYFAGRRQAQLSFLGTAGLASLVRMAPPMARTWLTDQVFVQRRAAGWEPWAVDEVSNHDWRMVLEAGGALGRFSSSEWIGEVDVPAAVVVTTGDTVVPVRRQLRLAEAIPGARTFRVDAEHSAVINAAGTFVPALVEACRDVADRASASDRRRAG